MAQIFTSSTPARVRLASHYCICSFLLIIACEFSPKIILQGYKRMWSVHMAAAWNGARTSQTSCFRGTDQTEECAMSRSRCPTVVAPRSTLDASVPASLWAPCRQPLEVKRRLAAVVGRTIITDLGSALRCSARPGSTPENRLCSIIYYYYCYLCCIWKRNIARYVLAQANPKANQSIKLEKQDNTTHLKEQKRSNCCRNIMPCTHSL